MPRVPKRIRWDHVDEWDEAGVTTHLFVSDRWGATMERDWRDGEMIAERFSWTPTHKFATETELLAALRKAGE